ncbi:MAG TPA: ATP-dependent DNA helicase [Clostridiaceae bacterium]|jgi:Rad3-related DNA helicase|nr:ATP-dependent DNA helicase [Clostridiaceae bacterium]
MEKYEISIRTLVEFILRYGDITTSDKPGQNVERAQYGAHIHKKLQQEFEKEKDYNKEAYVRHTYEKSDISLTVTGRADGWYITDDKLYVDEIKTVEFDLEIMEEIDPLHLAQAMCYAYVLSLDEKMNSIVNVIYYNIHTDEKRIMQKEYTFAELEEFFLNLCERYISWISFDRERKVKLHVQLKELKFPFPMYREGQRQLCTAVYRTIERENKLLVQAPTGIGKTISVLFPSLKAVAEGKGGRIFFLTARNAGVLAPQDTLLMLNSKANDLSFIALTAKEKICPFELACNPEDCEYAKGHYDRINDAVFESINNYRLFTRDVIEKISKKHKVCPFEFSLDVSEWVDVVIGDYNYLFDPRVYLKRFFSSKQDHVFLVDEAHNLIDRTRDMYTQKLYKKSFSEVRKKFKDRENGRNVYNKAGKVIRYFNKLNKSLDDKDYVVTEEFDNTMYMLVNDFTVCLTEFLHKVGSDDEKVTELFMNCLFFCKLLEIYDERFCYYTRKENSDIFACVYLADPSKIIGETLELGRSAILFSGTLEPLQYYYQGFGVKEDDKIFSVSSPFPKENRKVFICTDVSTRYKKRAFYYELIAEYILGLASLQKGNFIVYFSSYRYLKDVANCLPAELMDITVFIQPQTQDPDEREQFVHDFKSEPDGVRIGLCVLGGIYSEGIDLAGDRLGGVIVVGVGLPQVCLERDIIKMVYDRNQWGSGFMNAYVFPGINKVLQAAGRVIRTETDKGFIVLLDERFNENPYKSLLPEDMKSGCLYNKNDCIKEIKKLMES